MGISLSASDALQTVGSNCSCRACPVAARQLQDMHRGSAVDAPPRCGILDWSNADALRGTCAGKSIVPTESVARFGRHAPSPANAVTASTPEHQVLGPWERRELHLLPGDLFL